jgi:hypothetical protein
VFSERLDLELKVEFESIIFSPVTEYQIWEGEGVDLCTGTLVSLPVTVICGMFFRTCLCVNTIIAHYYKAVGLSP